MTPEELVDAVRERPGLGVKKLVTAISRAHPDWAVGSKEVREALASLEAAAVEANYAGAWHQSPDVVGHVLDALGPEFSQEVATLVCAVWTRTVEAHFHLLRYQCAIGTMQSGSGFGDFNKPSYVIPLPGDRFCISDCRNHRLQIIPRAHLEGNGGQRVFMWPVPGHMDGPGSITGQFRCPTGLALHGKVLFVSDYENGRVQRLHLTEVSGGGPMPTGEAQELLRLNGMLDDDLPPWKNWPLLPLNSMPFSSPQALAIDGSTLYIADDGEQDVDELSLEPATSRVYAIELDNDCRRRYVIRASGPRVAKPALRPKDDFAGTFANKDALRCVRGLATHVGELFVADGHADTVHVYSCETGAWLRDIGVGLRQPYGLCVAHGNLYVTEYGGGAISVFTVGGALVQRVLLASSKKTRAMPMPWGIALDARQSTACVVDHAHHMLQVFRVGGPRGESGAP